jgi:hypothetical protein
VNGVAQTRSMPHKSKPPALEALAGLRLNQAAGAARAKTRFWQFLSLLMAPAASSGAMPMNSPHPSAANRERLLTIMRVCHRLQQPLPPRTRLAPLVGCTSRQLHRYIERLKAEGVVALRRGSRCVHVQEIAL